MKNYWNNIFLENSEYIGRCITSKEYILTMEGKVPYLSKKERKYQVQGELYKVEEKDLEEIDKHEGNEEWYCRRRLYVKLNENEIIAYTYFNSRGEGEVWKEGDFRSWMKERFNYA